jgi:hypothetical protein
MPALRNDQRGCNLTVARDDMCGVPNVYLDAMLADDLAEMLDLVCEQCAISSDVFACRE